MTTPAPTNAPVSVPTPPRIDIRRPSADVRKNTSLGPMKLLYIASRTPATPAKKTAIVNDRSLWRGEAGASAETVTDTRGGGAEEPRDEQRAVGQMIRRPPRSEERRVGKECRSRWSP